MLRDLTTRQSFLLSRLAVEGPTLLNVPEDPETIACREPLEAEGLMISKPGDGGWGRLYELTEAGRAIADPLIWKSRTSGISPRRRPRR